MAITDKLVLPGNNAPEEVVKKLVAEGYTIIPASIAKFGSGEPFAELCYDMKPEIADWKARLKDAKVVVVQSCGAGYQSSVTENEAHLRIMIRTLKRYGAGLVTAVLPFAAYERQDEQKDPDRLVSVTAQDFPMDVANAGADRVITTVPHSNDANKFWKAIFGTNHKLIESADIFADHIAKSFPDTSNVLIGAPDGGNKPNDMAQKEARKVTSALYKIDGTSPEELNHLMFRIIKERPNGGKPRIKQFLVGAEGEDTRLDGKDIIIIDDMTDTGSTTLNAARAARERGAKSVTVYLGHGILSGNALGDLLSEKHNGVPVITKLVITDSFPDIENKIKFFKTQYPQISERVEIVSSAGAISKSLAEVQEQAFRPTKYQNMAKQLREIGQQSLSVA